MARQISPHQKRWYPHTCIQGQIRMLPLLLPYTRVYRVAALEIARRVAVCVYYKNNYKFQIPHSLAGWRTDSKTKIKNNKNSTDSHGGHRRPTAKFIERSNELWRARRAQMYATILAATQKLRNIWICIFFFFFGLRSLWLLFVIVIVFRTAVAIGFVFVFTYIIVYFELPVL